MNITLTYERDHHGDRNWTLWTMLSPQVYSTRGSTPLDAAMEMIRVLAQEQEQRNARSEMS